MRMSDWSSDVCSSDLLIDRMIADRVGEVEALGHRRHRREIVDQREGVVIIGDPPDDPPVVIESARRRVGALVAEIAIEIGLVVEPYERKSTRLNSSH